MNREFTDDSAHSLEAKRLARTVRFGSNREFLIPVLRQQASSDCGQTALRMLGYDSSSFAGELNTQQVFTLMAERLGETVLENIFLLSDKDEGMDYSKPHLVLLQKTGATHRNHWVIRVNDTIVCPSAGVSDASRYITDNNYSPVVAFKLPFQQSSTDVRLTTL